MVNRDDYTLRISKANPAELVVINFELVLAFLDVGDIEKTKNAVEQLMRSLNFEISLAHDFFDVYRYVNERLVIAQFSQDEVLIKEVISEVRELMETLLVGWKDVEKQVADLPPVAGEGPAVYSGLTYSKNGTADEYIDDGDKKGYMA